MEKYGRPSKRSCKSWFQLKLYFQRIKINVYCPIKDKNARMTMFFFLIEMELNISTIIAAKFFYFRGVDCVKNLRTAGAK